MRRVPMWMVCFGLLFSSFQLRTQQAPPPATNEPLKNPYRVQEFMVPMRDGVHLQTVVITYGSSGKPLPILLNRTPYGVLTQEMFDQAVQQLGKDFVVPEWDQVIKDGYIFVFQNLRGRFKSEGSFELTSRYDPNDPRQTNEVNDAYDTIDWLVKHVPNNNGRVGIWGTSYDGLTAGITLLHPHPALKAVDERAAPVDQWMNDDMHRFGALRESYALEYSVLEQASKEANTHFAFDQYDTYEWYLQLGPLVNVNARYEHGRLPFWNSVVAHPDYDDFWKREAWVNQLHSSTVPTLNVAGFWDQEDPWGPWQIFHHAEEHDPDSTSYMVAGPWFHGEWSRPEGDRIGPVAFGGHNTSLEFRRDIEAPFLRYYLHGEGQKPAWKANTFQTGSNTWHTYTAWPPNEAKLTALYLREDGTLSFTLPAAQGKGFREYVSDPANPVPYRTRPISPTYPGPEWVTWEVADQRFVDHRPDVLSFVSDALEKDLVVSGPIAATLFASTSGTDADFIVKLIDVYPQTGQKSATEKDSAQDEVYADSLNGYELPIAMEVRRGRYLKSFEHATPLEAGKPVEWAVPLRDHDHVFLKGHRLMVQIQSSWFPVIDRNPQRFVQSIFDATPQDYVQATQRVYCSQKLPSHISLPIIPHP